MRAPYRCLWCDEHVVPGDLTHSLLPGYHYACALRVTIGPIEHLQGTCSCFVTNSDGTRHHEADPPGITRRQAAGLVADFVRQHQRPRPGRN